MWKMTCFVIVNALLGCFIGAICGQEGLKLLFVAIGYLLIVFILAFANV